ncbi:hypothetical protein DOK67_0001894 [Enterococcus sp. DIV0212c]
MLLLIIYSACYFSITGYASEVFPDKVLTEEGWKKIENSNDVNLPFGNGFQLKISQDLGFRPYVNRANNQLMMTYQMSSELIINEKLLVSDSFPKNAADAKDIFAESRVPSNQRSYYQKGGNLLLKFVVDGKYIVELLYETDSNGFVDKTYFITNQSGVDTKVGVSELIGLGPTSVQVNYGLKDLYSIKGLYLDGKEFQLIYNIGDFTDWQDSYGSSGNLWDSVSDLKKYAPANALGKGVVKGREELKGNGFDYYIISEKNPGKYLKNDETITIKNSFSMLLNYTAPPPALSLKEQNFTVSQSNGKAKLSGTALESKRQFYSLVYKSEESENETIVKNFDVKPNEKVDLENAIVDFGHFKPGTKHKGYFYLKNDRGIKGNKVNININVLPLDAKPIMQKVPKGDAFDKKMNDLLKEIVGDNVEMIKLKKPDTSKIGFSTAVVTIKDNSNTTLDVTVPVNVYDEKTTTFYDKESVAVDAPKEIHLTVGELKQSTDWDQLVSKKVTIKAWDMLSGDAYSVKLKDNGVQEKPKVYPVVYMVKKEEQEINHIINARVTGFLKFVTVPNFDFGKSKIPMWSTLIPRKNPEQIMINDERGPNKQWRLTATLLNESQSMTHKLGSLLFVDEQGNKHNMTLDESVLIKEGETIQTAIQPITWSKETGLLFEISPGSFAGEYNSVVEWFLEDVPKE